MKLLSYLFVLLCVVNRGFCARILGMYLFPSFSHQVVFRALTAELARLGHELVIITPDPAFKDKPHPNVTEIDIQHTYGTFQNIMRMNFRPKLGVFVDEESLINMPNTLDIIMATIFNDTNVDSFLRDSSQKFDLVIGEALFYAPLRIAKMYDAPAIWFSSFYGSPLNYQAMGAPRHPELYPNYMRYKHINLNIWERLWGMYLEHRLYNEYYSKGKDAEIEVINKYFGTEMTEEELTENLRMLFLNVHPIFDGNRPVSPNIIYLGGVHMKPLQLLPKDLQTYLDSSSRGVVYVSLGTNVHTQFMDPNLLNQFLKAFEALPYDVLWKFVGDLPWKPKNLRTQKWFPQRDLLAHPNVKAFITQGGLQSTDEAIDAGVPLVGIPMLGDQGHNVDYYVKLGIGVKLETLTLTADKLVEAVETVINDEKYRENIRALTPVFRAHSASALQRAVSAVDTVLQTGGRHLRPATAGMTWTTYLMLDIVALLTAILCVVLVTLYVSLKALTNVIFKRKTDKRKMN